MSKNSRALKHKTEFLSAKEKHIPSDVPSEIHEDLSSKKAFENDLKVPSDRVSPSHSRSTSGTSRSQVSLNDSEYDACDVLYDNEENSVMSHRSMGSGDVDIDSQATDRLISNKIAREEVDDKINVHNNLVDAEELPLLDNSLLTTTYNPPGIAGKSGLTKLRNTKPTLDEEMDDASSHWSKSPSASALLQSSSAAVPRSHKIGSINGYSTSPNLGSLRTLESNSPETANPTKKEAKNLSLPLTESNNSKVNKQSARKKKRSPSWYNILSSSYKQKNDDYHKFFKSLPESERLLVDYACALMKDILVQGRLYISQNYICFRSLILKWQTVLMISFKDIQNITKEKTAKIIPNAIQFQVNGREKSPTFTSFTQRDRAFLQINKIWQNALADKPLNVEELWNDIQGNDRVCSSDEGSGKPETPDGRALQLSKSKKMKRTKKANTARHTDNEGGDSNSPKQLATPVDGAKDNGTAAGGSSEEEDKSSSRESIANPCGGSLKEEDCVTDDDNDGPAEHCKEDLRRTYLSREYDVSASSMFQTLFGDDSTFMRDYLEEKGSHNIEVGTWEDGAGEYQNQKVKQLVYALALNNPLAPKLSYVDETEVFYCKESKANRSYAIDCTARMKQGVPYADYFVTVMRYCIRKTSGNSCELRITVDIRYMKTPWGVIKTFIEKNVAGGMKDNFNLLDRKLQRVFASESHQRRLTVPPTLKSSSSAAKIQKRSNTSASQDLSLKQNGKSSRFSSLHKNNSKMPSSISSTAPFGHTSSGNYAIKTHQEMETKTSKLLPLLAFIVLSLLLWSNYTMYQRLLSLESLHSSTSPDRFDFSSAPKTNGIYNVDRTDDDTAVLKGLTNFEQRLARLEVTVHEYVTLSNRRHEALLKKLNQILREIRSNVKV